MHACMANLYNRSSGPVQGASWMIRHAGLSNLEKTVVIDSFKLRS